MCQVNVVMVVSTVNSALVLSCSKYETQLSSSLEACSSSILLAVVLHGNDSGLRSCLQWSVGRRPGGTG